MVKIARAVEAPRTGVSRQGKPAPERQHRLDDEQRSAIRQAYRDGQSMAQLARTYSVRRDTISKIIRDGGVPVRGQRQFKPEQIAEAGELYRQGWSLARLGERYGFDGQTIRTHLTRAGVVMRGPHDWQR